MLYMKLCNVLHNIAQTVTENVQFRNYRFDHYLTISTLYNGVQRCTTAVQCLAMLYELYALYNVVHNIVQDWFADDYWKSCELY